MISSHCTLRSETYVRNNSGTLLRSITATKTSAIGETATSGVEFTAAPFHGPKDTNSMTIRSLNSKVWRNLRRRSRRLVEMRHRVSVGRSERISLDTFVSKLTLAGAGLSLQANVIHYVTADPAWPSLLSMYTHQLQIIV